MIQIYRLSDTLFRSWICIILSGFWRETGIHTFKMLILLIFKYHWSTLDSVTSLWGRVCRVRREICLPMNCLWLQLIQPRRLFKNGCIYNRLNSIIVFLLYVPFLIVVTQWRLIRLIHLRQFVWLKLHLMAVIFHIKGPSVFINGIEWNYVHILLIITLRKYFCS